MLNDTGSIPGTPPNFLIMLKTQSDTLSHRGYIRRIGVGYIPTDQPPDPKTKPP